MVQCRSVSSVCSFMCQAYVGHNYIGHKYIGHYYVGYNYVDHNYIGHNYIGHDYIGVQLYVLLTNRSACADDDVSLRSVRPGGDSYLIKTVGSDGDCSLQCTCKMSQNGCESQEKCVRP